MTFSATSQSVFYKQIYHKILHRTQQIAKSFSNKFSVELPLTTITFRYRLKAMLIFVLFIVSQGFIIVEIWIIYPSRSLWPSILNSILRSVYPLVVLHLILYIENVVIIIEELIRQIQRLGSSLDRDSKFEFLSNVKFMHIEIWELVVEINKFFGWSLLCVTIYAFIYITKQLYFIFTVIHVQWNLLAMIGKLRCF